MERMQAADWPQVRAIYAEGIAAGDATFETEAPGWPEWDQNHLPVCRLVARRGGQVVAWAALSPVSRRRVYAGVAEVSIYVAAAAQGQGIGTQLLQALITASEQAGFWMLQGSVFATNELSLRLHRKCGFREVGRRERIAQSRGAWHDTILLERRSQVVGT